MQNAIVNMVLFAATFAALSMLFHYTYGEYSRQTSGQPFPAWTVVAIGLLAFVLGVTTVWCSVNAVQEVDNIFRELAQAGNPRPWFALAGIATAGFFAFVGVFAAVTTIPRVRSRVKSYF